MRIAIVQDALCVAGGSERLVLWMKQAFPQAPIFTSVFLPGKTFAEYGSMDVHVLPFARYIRTETQFKVLYLLWLFEIQRMDFSEFDVVLSSSTYLAKYIQPAPNVKHASYIYAPFRLLWKPESYSQESLPTPRFLSWFIRKMTPQLRKWDSRRTRQISRVATTCQNMAKEIQEKYQLKASIIYPPIDLSSYPEYEEDGGYYLSVSRLISHKRVDLAIKACNALGKNLVVVGDGPEMLNLRRLAGPTIQFTGNVDNKQLTSLYSHSKGLIFSSHEDFGIVPLEAQACGVPVIAFGKGGVLETVREGYTGIFFKDQVVDSLIAGIQQFEKTEFDHAKIRSWIKRFDPMVFLRTIQDFVISA